jgi:hypothetical protein
MKVWYQNIYNGVYIYITGDVTISLNCIEKAESSVTLPYETHPRWKKARKISGQEIASKISQNIQERTCPSACSSQKLKFRYLF